MTTAQASGVSHYEVHGVGLCVSASRAEVLDALHLRLSAFAHRPAGKPQVTLHFEEGDVTPARPDGVCRPVYETPDGTLAYYTDADVIAGRFGGVTLVCDPARATATFTAASFTGRDFYLATHPLCTVALMELLERRGLYALHAACLTGERGRGVLLAGPSGSGKSTLSVLLARAGLGFLSDDIVFLMSGEDRVRVLAFPDAVGLTPASAAVLPWVPGLSPEPPGEGFPKRLIRIEQLAGAWTDDDAIPAAVVFPYVSPREPSRLVPLDGAEAFVRLVPDVLLTNLAATQAHLAVIAQLVREADCYTLCSGRDLQRAAAMVATLVEE